MTIRSGIGLRLVLGLRTTGLSLWNMERLNQMARKTQRGNATEDAGTQHLRPCVLR